mgnify:CR=1 FL=1
MQACSYTSMSTELNHLHIHSHQRGNLASLPVSLCLGSTGCFFSLTPQQQHTQSEEVCVFAMSTSTANPAQKDRKGKKGKKKQLRKVDQALITIQRLVEELPENELEEFRDAMAEMLGFDHDDDDAPIESKLLDSVVADLRAALPGRAAVCVNVAAADVRHGFQGRPDQSH